MPLSTAIKALTLLTGSGAAMAAAAADGDWLRKDPDRPSEGVRALPLVKRLTRSKAAETAAPTAATAASAAANASSETALAAAGLLRLSSSGKGPAASSLVARQTRLCGHGSDQGGPGCLSRRVLQEVQWQQLGADIDGEAAGDQSGYSVAISSDGSVVAVGAPKNAGNGEGYSGHVRVWEWNEGASTWQQRGGDINGEALGDESGFSVAISSDGSIVAVGTPWNDGNGEDSGLVRVWEWKESASTWQQKGGDINGEADDDESGYSVAISSDGSVVAVGAPKNNGNGEDSGHVRVWEWNESASTWEQRGADIDGEAAFDWFGYSVAISSDGSVVAIGAPYIDLNGVNSGLVRVWEWNESASTWQQRGGDINGEAGGDLTGYSVAISSDGSVIAVGTPKNAGHVRVWEWNESASTWQQRGADIDGEAAYDYSGDSVAISSDGSVVAIGTIFNDGNGENSGHVRAWEWKEGASTWQWQQRGADIDGEAAYDWLGYSVAISSDGSVVAIGAPWNDGNGFSSGHVRVFKVSGLCSERASLLTIWPHNEESICEETASTCEAVALLDRDNSESCNDWCNKAGLVCDAAFHDEPSGTCGRGGGVSCDHAHGNLALICVCVLTDYKLLEPDSKPKCDAFQAIKSVEECEYAATSGSIGDHVLHGDGRVVVAGDWSHTPCGCFLDATKKIWFDYGTTCTQVHDEYSGYSLICRDSEGNLE